MTKNESRFSLTVTQLYSEHLLVPRPVTPCHAHITPPYHAHIAPPCHARALSQLQLSIDFYNFPITLTHVSTHGPHVVFKETGHRCQNILASLPTQTHITDQLPVFLFCHVSLWQLVMKKRFDPKLNNGHFSATLTRTLIRLQVSQAPLKISERKSRNICA